MPLERTRTPSVGLDPRNLSRPASHSITVPWATMTEPSITDQIEQLAALLSGGDVAAAADLLAHLRNRWRREAASFTPKAVRALQDHAEIGRAHV